jgi:hypothetical protein
MFTDQLHPYLNTRASCTVELQPTSETDGAVDRTREASSSIFQNKKKDQPHRKGLEAKREQKIILRCLAVDSRAADVVHMASRIVLCPQCKIFPSGIYFTVFSVVLADG